MLPIRNSWFCCFPAFKGKNWGGWKSSVQNLDIESEYFGEKLYYSGVCSSTFTAFPDSLSGRYWLLL